MKELIQEHQANVDGGTGQWIKKCANQALDPAFLLDKEIQRLDMIPQKLSICISYATSACDCFNHTSIIEETVETVLREQNYEFAGIAMDHVNVEMMHRKDFRNISISIFRMKSA